MALPRSNPKIRSGHWVVSAAATAVSSALHPTSGPTRLNPGRIVRNALAGLCALAALSYVALAHATPGARGAVRLPAVQLVANVRVPVGVTPARPACPAPPMAAHPSPAPSATNHPAAGHPAAAGSPDATTPGPVRSERTGPGVVGRSGGC